MCDKVISHDTKIEWMAVWAAKNGCALALKGEVGFGRECGGVIANGSYLEYVWYEKKGWTRLDKNGEVWIPEDAYHKHECIAVLGRGVEAESKLYAWLKWFDKEGFHVETGTNDIDPSIGIIGVVLGQHLYCHIVRNEPVEA